MEGRRLYDYDQLMLLLPHAPRPLRLLFEGAGAALAAAAAPTLAPSPVGAPPHVGVRPQEERRSRVADGRGETRGVTRGASGGAHAAGGGYSGSSSNSTTSDSESNNDTTSSGSRSSGESSKSSSGNSSSSNSNSASDTESGSEAGAGVAEAGITAVVGRRQRRGVEENDREHEHADKSAAGFGVVAVSAVADETRKSRVIPTSSPEVRSIDRTSDPERFGKPAKAATTTSMTAAAAVVRKGMQQEEQRVGTESPSPPVHPNGSKNTNGAEAPRNGRDARLPTTKDTKGVGTSHTNGEKNFDSQPNNGSRSPEDSVTAAVTPGIQQQQKGSVRWKVDVEIEAKDAEKRSSFDEQATAVTVATVAGEPRGKLTTAAASNNSNDSVRKAKGEEEFGRKGNTKHMGTTKESRRRGGKGNGDKDQLSSSSRPLASGARLEESTLSEGGKVKEKKTRFAVWMARRTWWELGAGVGN